MALSFDGTGDKAIAQVQQYNNDAQISVFFRFLLPSTHGNAQFDRVFELGGGNRGDNTDSTGQNSGGLAVIVDSVTDNFEAYVWDADGFSAWDTYAPTQDVWEDVLMTSDTTGPSNKVYWNGAAAVEDTSLTRETSADRFSLGALNDDVGNQRYSKVEIADVAIWHGVILGTDARDILNAGFSPLLVHPANLVGYWPLIDANAQGVVGGDTLTVTGAVKSTHPGIVMPSSTIIGIPAAAASANIPAIVHHMKQQRGY